MTNKKYNLKLKSVAEYRAADLEILESSRRLNDGRWNNKNYISKLKMKSRISAGILMLVASLSRVERINWDAFEKACSDARPILVVAWHGSLVIPIYSLRNRGIFILTSLSGDGDLLAHTLYSFGFRCIRGSSSRGGMRALLQMVKLMKSGGNCAITVDGPRGPRHEVKPGAVLMAQKSGALLVPLGVAYSKCHKLNNWDKTEIPYPISKTVLAVGNPFSISGRMSIEDGCEMIKESIFACEKVAEQRISNG